MHGTHTKGKEVESREVKNDLEQLFEEPIAKVFDKETLHRNHGGYGSGTDSCGSGSDYCGRLHKRRGIVHHATDRHASLPSVRGGVSVDADARLLCRHEVGGREKV
ncbi:hypothetical protein KSP39_PZI017835 [Platanthera zijinensis]|uniref:Uncharacterized protein n=1 Tax=Platanthera zijinensis TaxID=2320716 RepID=A0AAP0B5V6_9ASPA